VGDAGGFAMRAQEEELCAVGNPPACGNEEGRRKNEERRAENGGLKADGWGALVENLKTLRQIEWLAFYRRLIKIERGGVRHEQLQAIRYL